MTPVQLTVLALTDAAFAGFRAAAGRSAAVHKLEGYLRATWLGVGFGVVAITVVVIWGAATLVGSDNPAALYASYVDAADRMVTVYATYATIVLLALLAWTLPIGERRTFFNVLILGPFTLLRPWVIIAGGLWSATGAEGWQVRGAIVLAVLVQLLVAFALERVQARVQARVIASYDPRPRRG